MRQYKVIYGHVPDSIIKTKIFINKICITEAYSLKGRRYRKTARVVALLTHSTITHQRIKYECKSCMYEIQHKSFFTLGNSLCDKFLLSSACTLVLGTIPTVQLKLFTIYRCILRHDLQLFWKKERTCTPTAKLLYYHDISIQSDFKSDNHQVY